MVSPCVLEAAHLVKSGIIEFLFFLLRWSTFHWEEFGFDFLSKLIQNLFPLGIFHWDGLPFLLVLDNADESQVPRKSAEAHFSNPHHVKNGRGSQPYSNAIASGNDILLAAWESL